MVPLAGATGVGFVNNGAFLRTTTGYVAQNDVITVPFTNGPAGTFDDQADHTFGSDGSCCFGSVGRRTSC